MNYNGIKIREEDCDLYRTRTTAHLITDVADKFVTRDLNKGSIGTAFKTNKRVTMTRLEVWQWVKRGIFAAGLIGLLFQANLILYLVIKVLLWRAI